MSNNSVREGEVILGLLKNFTSKPLTHAIQSLYDEAHEKIEDAPDEAIKLCEKALVILKDLKRETLPDAEQMADSKGRFHLLLASIHLSQKEWREAEEHYGDSRNAYHTMQWSHLESLSYLGLAIARRMSKDISGAVIACKYARDSIEHESVPGTIDIEHLLHAIREEELEIERSLLSQRIAPANDLHPSDVLHRELVWIPIVGDILDGQGSIKKDNIIDYLGLDDHHCNNPDFGVSMSDDSMRGHGILPGDIVLIRQQEEVDTGEIAAVVIETPFGRKGVLRQYYWTYGELADRLHWFLKANNPGSKHLVVIPSGMNVHSIKNIYEKEEQIGGIRNPIDYLEDSTLTVAGKYVGLVRKA